MRSFLSREGFDRPFLSLEPTFFFPNYVTSSNFLARRMVVGPLVSSFRHAAVLYPFRLLSLLLLVSSALLVVDVFVLFRAVNRFATSLTVSLASFFYCDFVVVRLFCKCKYSSIILARLNNFGVVCCMTSISVLLTVPVTVCLLRFERLPLFFFFSPLYPVTLSRTSSR